MATEVQTEAPKRSRRSKRGCRHYTPQAIEAALTALVLNGGNVLRTAERIGIPERTLNTWRNEDEERYRRIQQQRAPELERIIAHQAREYVVTAGQAERLALDATVVALATGNVRDPAATLKNISVSKAVNIDKLLAIEGRPTSVIEHRGDPLKRLENQGFVNSTAEEIPDTTRVPFRREEARTNGSKPGQLAAGEDVS